MALTCFGLSETQSRFIEEGFQFLVSRLARLVGLVERQNHIIGNATLKEMLIQSLGQKFRHQREVNARLGQLICQMKTPLVFDK